MAQQIVDDLVRGMGWGLLKAVTGGRYSSSGSHARLFEGTIGLLALAAFSWSVYSWLG
jgi:hypothetical protein